MRASRCLPAGAYQQVRTNRCVPAGACQQVRISRCVPAGACQQVRASRCVPADACQKVRASRCLLAVGTSRCVPASQQVKGPLSSTILTVLLMCANIDESKEIYGGLLSLWWCGGLWWCGVVGCCCGSGGSEKVRETAIYTPIHASTHYTPLPIHDIGLVYYLSGNTVANI